MTDARGGGRDLLILATALVASLALTSCSDAPQAQAPRRSSDAAPPSLALQPPAGDPVTQWCRDHPEVRCVGAPGGARGVVLEAEGRSRGLVWWDPGGPGLGLPDIEMAWSSIRPSALQDFDLVLPVEGWVESPPSRSCLADAAEGPDPSSCDLDSLALSPTDMRSLLQVAEAEVGTPVVGAYVQSFGATRSAALLAEGGRLGFEWAVFQSPGPPEGFSAGRLLHARAAAARRLYRDACRGEECRASADATLTRWSRSGLPGEATGREIALGLLAVATLPADNRTVVDEVGRALAFGRLPGELAGQLRRVGRQYEGRGPDAVEPSLIGLWADTCPRLTGWDALRDAPDPLVSASAWVFRGCSSSEPDVAGRQRDIGIPVLLLSGRNDTIVPPGVQGAWMGRLSMVRVLKGDGHFWDSTRVSRVVRSWVSKRSPAT